MSDSICIIFALNLAKVIPSFAAIKASASLYQSRLILHIAFTWFCHQDLPWQDVILWNICTLWQCGPLDSLHPSFDEFPWTSVFERTVVLRQVSFRCWNVCLAVISVLSLINDQILSETDLSNKREAAESLATHAALPWWLMKTIVSIKSLCHPICLSQMTKL